MYTLSLFPYLMSFQPLSPLIIRLTLGITLAYFGYHKAIKQSAHMSSGSNSVLYGWVEMIIAVFLIIGLWTQLAAALNALILVIKLGFKIKEKKFLTDGVNYYLLLLVMALSLILTGAGAFAIDYQL
ncbi:MAG: hypothetical protein KGJ35_00970 [Patescibacteria group bacterium]|nr:hypothetical protein [Patescibacteria group bacterium]